MSWPGGYKKFTIARHFTRSSLGGLSVRSGGGLHFLNSHSQSHSGVYSGVANLFSNIVGAAAS